MKKTLMAMMVALMPMIGFAQEKPEAYVSADLVTKHMWRGQDYGGVSIQPHGYISYLGFYFDAFASKSFDKNDKERIDFYAGYKAPFGLNVSFGSHWMSNADWGKRAFSTFIQLTVPFRLAGLDWRGRIGFTPAESSSYVTPVDGNPFYDSITDYLYADGPAIVEASIRATKDIEAKGFHVPVFMEFNTNPYTKRASIVGGVGVRLFQKK